MDYFQVIEKRRSIRAFQDRPLEAEKLERLLDTVDLAPSAGNIQGYHVFTVERPEHKDGLTRAALGQGFIQEAPLVLVFCAHPARSAGRYGRRGEELYCIQDATIAATYAMLTAAALGLATCWVGAFDEAEAARALDLAEGLRPIVILPVGYPAGEPGPLMRRGVADLVHRL